MRRNTSTFYHDGKISSQVLLETSFMDSWIMLEKHDPNICTCSYCDDGRKIKSNIKILLPEDKSHNSWRRLFWKKNSYFYFLRFTLATWRWFLHIDKWGGGWRFSSMPIGSYYGCSLISFLHDRKHGGNILESIFWLNPRKPEKSNICSSGCVCGETSIKKG